MADSQVQAKQVLLGWLDERKISTKHFASAMDYTYSHAWQLLFGEQPMTDAFIGRLLHAYGGEIADQISKILNGETIVEPTE